MWVLWLLPGVLNRGPGTVCDRLSAACRSGLHGLRRLAVTVTPDALPSALGEALRRLTEQGKIGPSSRPKPVSPVEAYGQVLIGDQWYSKHKKGGKRRYR